MAYIYAGCWHETGTKLKVKYFVNKILAIVGFFENAIYFMNWAALRLLQTSSRISITLKLVECIEIVNIDSETGHV